MSNNVIGNIDLERESIAGMLRNPQIIADVSPFLSINTYTSKTYGNCYEVMKGLYAKGEEVNCYAVANHISNLCITLPELSGGSLKEHLEELKIGISLNEKGTVEHCQKLAKLEICRERFDATKNVANFLKDKTNWEKPIDDIITFSDQLWEGNLSFYSREGGSEFTNIFDNLEQYFEERAQNPTVNEDLVGPWPRAHYLFGSFDKDASIFMLASRTGVGKSNWLLYWNIYLALKYNIPVLHMDNGELSLEELRFRGVAMLTGVPYSMLEDSTWSKNIETAKLVRAVYPRINNLKYELTNIGACSQETVLSKIRRFSLSKVGRGKKFKIAYDYFKGFSDDPKAPEWQTAGVFIDRLKALMKDEIKTCSASAPVQVNKSGVINNRKPNEINDSETVISLSDRLTQRTSHTFLMRRKTNEEMANEGPNLGNHKFIPLKYRSLGTGHEYVTQPVQMPDGSYAGNFLHIEQKSFNFKEIGDLYQTVDSYGQKYQDDKVEDDSDILLK